MRQRLRWLCFAAAVVSLGCITVPAPPGTFKIADEAIPSLGGGPVELRAKLGLKGRRVISQGVSNLSVDEDLYTAAVISRLSEQLRKRGVRVELDADRSIEVGIVHITIHMKPQFTCVIDFNRRLGDGPLRGLQSRVKRWRADKACSAAAAQVVIDTLNDPSVRAYLIGGSSDS